jgi:hypothetical protein
MSAPLHFWFDWANSALVVLIWDLLPPHRMPRSSVAFISGVCCMTGGFRD